MKIKEIYYYVFYKFYRFFDYFRTTRWLMATKASIVMGILEIWILFSIINYYEYFSGDKVEFALFSPIILLPSILIIGIKWVMFIFNDSWKIYAKEFDELPKAKQKKGTWILAFLVVFVVCNFVFSFYLNPPVGGLKW